MTQETAIEAVKVLELAIGVFRMLAKGEHPRGMSPLEFVEMMKSVKQKLENELLSEIHG